MSYYKLSSFKTSLKSLIALCSIFVSFTMLTSCGGGEKAEEAKDVTTEKPSTSDYDPNRGIGKYTEVKLEATLNATMADGGEKIANVKCFSCHKPTEEKLVGPGWKGVTERRTPVWMMNFLTNPEPMLDKDPELQAQLEICLVRMPNQNINDEEARNIYEYMRKIDGLK